MTQVTQEKYRGAPQLESTICFSHQRESHLESGGEDPEVLNDADQAFLLNHIRKGTRGTYKSGWHRFKTFCESFGIDPQWAPVPLIVKFIRHQFEANVSLSVVLMAISAISKYHVVDENTGTPISQHSLVSMAKKAFWQQRP